MIYAENHRAHPESGPRRLHLSGFLPLLGGQRTRGREDQVASDMTFPITTTHYWQTKDQHWVCPRPGKLGALLLPLRRIEVPIFSRFWMLALARRMSSSRLLEEANENVEKATDVVLVSLIRHQATCVSFCTTRTWGKEKYSDPHLLYPAREGRTQFAVSVYGQQKGRGIVC